MDIVETEPVSAERASLVPIAQFNRAPMIACLVENVLTIPVFVPLDGLTLIVPSKSARTIVTEMGTVTMEHVHAVQNSMDLTVQFPFALTIVPTMVSA